MLDQYQFGIILINPVWKFSVGYQIYLVNPRRILLYSSEPVSEQIPVTISDDTKLELSYLYRNVWIKRLPEDSIYELKQYKGYLQTAAVLTDDKAKFAEVAKRLADVGVVRLTTAGNMSRTVSGEAHDGVYALREYSRIVEIEKY